MANVKLQQIIEKMKLENVTPELDISKIKITQPDINRPALQLAGYFEHFEAIRIQIIGFVEYSYMKAMPQERQQEIYRKFLSFDIPAIVFCRDLEPDDLFKQIAMENEIPLLKTQKATSAFTGGYLRRGRFDYGGERHR